jgi:amino acid adenylation domain-containing protein
MRLLHDFLMQSAAARPVAPAVHCPKRGVVSYGELDALANRVAHFLMATGVKPGDRVGIWLHKSSDAIAATQGVLRAGGAYVPIDPLSPVARAASLVGDCNMSALIGTESGLRALEARGEMELPPCLSDGAGPGAPWSSLVELSSAPPARCLISPDSLAYILYTSGSTGVPKGVCISHKNALAFIEWAVAELSPTPSDVFGNHAPLHFDLSVLDVYAAFASGASVAIVPETESFAAERVVERMVRQGVTIWYSVPSALVLMMESGGLLERNDLCLRQILFAGEPFPPAALARLRKRFENARLLNLYGPTETNVCTFYELPPVLEDSSSPIPIGISCSGDEVWAEKEDGSRARPGEIGELLVRGPTVMLGYWGCEPHSAGAPYRTGDRARVRADGGFDFLGRRDHMVKIRGYRVELGDVEAALGQHPAIREVTVAVVGSGLEARLVAALVARGEERVALLALKAFCAERLPRYMIIDRVVWLESLPRTSNGKLDRHAIEVACKRRERDHGP